MDPVVAVVKPTQARSGRRTHRSRKAISGVLAGAAALTALAVGATPSGAIVPGPNGLIAFESSRDGNTEIYVMNPDGTVPRNLTRSKTSFDVFPAWSPDGSQISFSSDRAETGDADVYKMNADGSNVTRLTDSPGEDRGTSWTSDGEKIVFHSARDRDATHAFDVFIMDADGSDQTKLFTNGSAAYVCGNSETGTIVFNSNADGDFDIYTMDIDGSNVVKLTDNTTLDSGPKWSPDCSQISFNSTDSGGSLDIFRMDADGSDLVNLTNTPGIFDAFSAWSPDDSRITFSSNRDEGFEIYTMSATDGSDVERLTTTDPAAADFRPDWGTAPPVAVVGPPTSAQDCKGGGWKRFNNPSFDNQGDCVSFANAGEDPPKEPGPKKPGPKKPGPEPKS